MLRLLFQKKMLTSKLVLVLWLHGDLPFQKVFSPEGPIQSANSPSLSRTLRAVMGKETVLSLKWNLDGIPKPAVDLTIIRKRITQSAKYRNTF